MGGTGVEDGGWDRGREGKWPEGLELGMDRLVDFLLEFEKRDKSFRFFCEGSMSIIEVASLAVFDARGKGEAEGSHEGNEQVEMNGKRGEAGAG